jgi:hypothetical protein
MGNNRRIFQGILASAVLFWGCRSAQTPELQQQNSKSAGAEETARSSRTASRQSQSDWTHCRRY